MEKAPGKINKTITKRVGRGALLAEGTWGPATAAAGPPLPLAQGQGVMGRTPRMWQLPQMLLLTEAGAT